MSTINANEYSATVQAAERAIAASVETGDRTKLWCPQSDHQYRAICEEMEEVAEDIITRDTGMEYRGTAADADGYDASWSVLVHQ